MGRAKKPEFLYEQGQVIRDKREKLGMTQEELGDLVGVRYQTIQKYEKGETIPPMNRINLLADALKLSQWEITPEQYRTSDSAINGELLKAVLSYLEDYSIKNRITLTAKEKSDIVSKVYAKVASIKDFTKRQEKIEEYIMVMAN